MTCTQNVYVCISTCRQAPRYRSQRDTKAIKIKNFLIVIQLFKRKQWFPCFYVSYPKHNSMKTSQKINKEKIAVVPFLPLKSVFHVILGLHHLQKLQIPKIWSKYCTFHRAVIPLVTEKKWRQNSERRLVIRKESHLCLPWHENRNTFFQHLSPFSGLFQCTKVILPLLLLSLGRLLNFIKTAEAEEEISKPKSLLLLSHWRRRALITSR